MDIVVLDRSESVAAVLALLLDGIPHLFLAHILRTSVRFGIITVIAPFYIIQLPCHDPCVVI